MATPLPFPAWLAAHADPIVDELLDDLDSDEWRELYRVHLADLARARWRPRALPLAWHAFVRAGEEIRRRNTTGQRA